VAACSVIGGAVGLRAQNDRQGLHGQSATAAQWLHESESKPIPVAEVMTREALLEPFSSKSRIWPAIPVSMTATPTPLPVTLASGLFQASSASVAAGYAA